MRRPLRFRSRYVSHEGATVVFRCERCGETYRVAYDRLPPTKRIGVDGVALLARWWSVDGKTIAGGCPRCERT